MSERISAPGCYDMPMDAYLADPCVSPSLSSGVTATLLERSPLHAWMEHPRLNPQYESAHAKEFDIGSAFHALFLEGEDKAEVIEAESYRTKAAQEARDAAYAAGKIPLLPHHYAAVQEMERAARRQLAQHEARNALATGESEQTLIWQSSGLWCRARLDWKPSSGRVFTDIKTTSTSANPDAWVRSQLFGNSHHIQAAHYCDGIREVLREERPVFQFMVIETKPPYAMSIVAVGEAVMDLANRQIAHARQVWAECMERGEWPAYPTQTAWADLASYMVQRWEDRKIADESRETIEGRYAL